MIRKLRFALIALLIICSCLSAAGCQNSLRAGINIHKTPSEKFSDAEIDSAIDCVINQFNAEYTGSKLTDLWYDEERSDLSVKHYEKNNAIALLSNFETGGIDVCGSFEPNDRYTEWWWILVRNSKDDEWKVKTSGY